MKRPAFMSYAREDAAFALRLAADLKARGALIWLDQLDIRPGRQWDREVEQALTACSEMLVIMSSAATDSNNVMDEVAFALEERKTVIPVLYSECRVPFRLRRVQYIDFKSDYQSGLQALLNALAQEQPVVAASEEKPGPLPAGVEPDAVEALHKADLGRIRKEEERAADKTERARLELEEVEAARNAEQERLDREKAEAARRAEQERLDREKAEAARRAEQERLDREKAEAARKAEQVRLDREKAEVARKAEQVRLDREKAEAARKAEQLRLDREKAEAARKAEQERLDREKVEAARKAEQLRLQREKEAARQAEQERRQRADWIALKKRWKDEERARRPRQILLGVLAGAFLLVLAVLFALNIFH